MLSGRFHPDECFNSPQAWKWIEHTSRVDLNLLHRRLVQDGTGLVQLESRETLVGDRGLDLGVANHLELDIKGSIPLVQVDGGGAGRGGQHQRKTGGKLHFGRGWLALGFLEEERDALECPAESIDGELKPLYSRPVRRLSFLFTPFLPWSKQAEWKVGCFLTQTGRKKRDWRESRESVRIRDTTV